MAKKSKNGKKLGRPPKVVVNTFVVVSPEIEMGCIQQVSVGKVDVSFEDDTGQSQLDLTWSEYDALVASIAGARAMLK